MVLPAEQLLMAELLLAPLHTEGVNNGAPKKTRERLEQAGSWKRQRVVIILPSGKDIPAKVAMSLINLGKSPNNASTMILAEGFEVGVAYSKAIEGVLQHPELSTWEYILTVEHDNLPPWDGLLRLIERMEANPRFACIGGLYFTKGHGGVPQIWGDPKDPVLNFRPQLPDTNGGLVECNGTGMGFNLWRMSMFKDKKLRRPWFVTQKHNGVATQDLYFWANAKAHGYRCAIDCSVKVGHLDTSTGVVW
jgi:hypothetical protein